MTAFGLLAGMFAAILAVVFTAAILVVCVASPIIGLLAAYPLFLIYRRMWRYVRGWFALMSVDAERRRA